uniref:DUF6824 domain-containing protein n=1 Tax=Entomoneis paludosa TaxID=265537 RepID=A0A7S3DS81_9STRA|mmetsp:Transcript_32067/g.66956  ORF Transcript_32067/g.66956 Transcript_32067/m.66956 type:complete len:141 (+) Transcript_32067:31-453(+)
MGDKNVFFGSGGEANKLRSGSRYSTLIETCCLDYVGVQKRGKREFVEKCIIRRILVEGGRFFVVEPKGMMLELSPDKDMSKIFDKVSQALRDRAKEKKMQFMCEVADRLSKAERRLEAEEAEAAAMQRQLALIEQKKSYE